MSFKILRKEDRIKIDFSSKTVYWERRLSELVKGKVIMDLKNAKRLLKTKGDMTVYKVYDVWKTERNFIDLYQKFKIKSSITLLRHGVFSTEKEGELFLTYGHKHEKYRGELYKVLSGSCFLLASDGKLKTSYLIDLKEGDSVFIHPRWIHRLIAKTEDCAVIGYVPHDAGHNYEIVKGRGFPVHVFLTDGWFEIKKNPKYRWHKIIEVKAKKINLSLEKVASILNNPKKNEKFYTRILSN